MLIFSTIRHDGDGDVPNRYPIRRDDDDGPSHFPIRHDDDDPNHCPIHHYDDDDVPSHCPIHRDDDVPIRAFFVSLVLILFYKI